MGSSILDDESALAKLPAHGVCPDCGREWKGSILRHLADRLDPPDLFSKFFFHPPTQFLVELRPCCCKFKSLRVQELCDLIPGYRGMLAKNGITVPDDRQPC